MSIRRLAALAVLALVVAVAIVAAQNAGTVQPVPTATVTAPAASVTASAAQPTPASPAPGGAVTIRATVARVPAEFRYVVAGSGAALGGAATFRILLLDLDAAAAPTVGGSTRASEVAVVSMPVPAGSQAAPRLSVSASGDGHALVIEAMPPAARQTIYVLDVPSATSRLLFDGNAAGTAVVSADGATFAFARTGTPAVEGLWIGSTADGSLRRVVATEPGRIGLPPTPIAFLPAGTQLGISASAYEGDFQIALVDTAGPETRLEVSSSAIRFTGGDVRRVGRGSGFDAGDGRTLLVRSSRTLFGGDSFVATVDLATGTVREVYRPGADRVITLAAWHPARDRYVVKERALCCGATIPWTVTVRRLDGTATKVAESPFIGDVWWSRDGSRLFAIGGGDDSTAPVVDLLTNATVLSYCLRGPGPPPCP